jgi:hypothetical protein
MTRLAGTRIQTGVLTRIVDGSPRYTTVVTVTMSDGQTKTVLGDWSQDKAAVEAHALRLAAKLRQETKGKDYMRKELEPGDIIQLDPEKHAWGPLLCIVDEVKGWGVTCFWLQATERGSPPARCYYRAETGTFTRVGTCEWHFVERPDGA